MPTPEAVPNPGKGRYDESQYWASDTARRTLTLIQAFEKSKSYRPTVVVAILNAEGQPLVVRHHTTEGSWGLIQGLIEPHDPHPLAAGCREAYEEGSVTDDMIATCLPFLGEQGLDYVETRVFGTGYTTGGYYVFVGITLKRGADVSILPPPGQPQALLDRRWCASLEEAITLLRVQPGVENVSLSTRTKVERVLIPALQSIYEPHSMELLQLLDRIV